MVPAYHRKVWEHCFVVQALWHAGVLDEGKRGLGFAALRLAGLVGASRALALLPQWTIDWRRAPWERRSAANSRSFEDVWKRADSGRLWFRAWVVFHPWLKDRRPRPQFPA